MSTVWRTRDTVPQSVVQVVPLVTSRGSSELLTCCWVPVLVMLQLPPICKSGENPVEAPEALFHSTEA